LFSVINPFVLSRDLIQRKQQELLEAYKFSTLISHIKASEKAKKVTTWTLDWSQRTFKFREIFRSQKRRL